MQEVIPPDKNLSWCLRVLVEMTVQEQKAYAAFTVCGEDDPLGFSRKIAWEGLYAARRKFGSSIIDKWGKESDGSENAAP